jgi:hypothetical protein
MKPWIAKTSLCSVKASPTCIPYSSDLYEGLDEDVAEVVAARPDRIAVAVAVGTNVGQPLIIGMKFAAAGPVNDNLCIGIEALGCIGSGRTISIAFAPFSGRCFIEHEGITIQAKALPNVLKVSEGCAWIHVTDKGGIRFLRQFEDGQLEDTGFLPSEMLPNWIQSYFGCIDFWMGDLSGAVEVCVEHSGNAFPIDMPVCNEHVNEIKATWSALGDDSDSEHDSHDSMLRWSYSHDMIIFTTGDDSDSDDADMFGRVSGPQTYRDAPGGAIL